MEAALLFVLVWAGLRIASLEALRRLLKVHAPRISAAAAPLDTLEGVGMAIRRVAARVPAATCLVQAIAGEVMVERRGLTSELHFGVRKATPFDAHAWLESQGVVVVGATEAVEAYRVVFSLSHS